MRSLPRKLLTAGLLAIYGGIAVLGYGLHDLAPDHHHDAAGEYLAHDHRHSESDGHANQHSATSSGKLLSSAHECEICVFLDQMRSERPTVAAEVVSQQHVAAVSVETPRIASLAIPGLHAPRGPPLLIG